MTIVRRYTYVCQIEKQPWEIKRLQKKNTPTRTFEEWIDEKGVDVVARYLGVHRASVNHWRAGRCDPRVDYLRRLKRWSKGELSYEQMIERATPTNSQLRNVRR